MDICQPPCAWETGGTYSYGGTAAIWKRPIRHHQPSEPAALRLLEASEAAGSHNVCEEYAVTHGLKFNPDNTQLIRFRSQSTFMYHDCISLDGVDLKFCNTVMHLGHLLSYNLDDTPDIIRVTKDLNRKANFVLCTFKSADPFVKCFLIKAYCLSLYDCTLWSLSCKSLHVIQVAINNVFRKVWNLPFKSHTAIVHCVARIFPICNLIFHRFYKLYSHAISHSSAIVKSTFLRSSSLIYTFFGHNYMSGHQYLKFYNSYDIYCANIIRNYRYYYGLFSPYEDVIRTVSCD